MDSQSFNEDEYDQDSVSDESDYSSGAKPKRKKVIKKQPAAGKNKPAPKPKATKETRRPNDKPSKAKPRVLKEAEDLKKDVALVKKAEDLVHIEPLKPLNNEDYEALEKCEDAPLFSLNYQTHLAKVLNIYDGDTITAVFYIKGDLRKYKIRINGIDTAEMKDGDPEVSQLAHQTMKALLPMKGKIVKAELGKFDKYGRVLSRITVATDDGEIDITKWMIEQGIAKAYDGKKKNVFTKEDAQRLKGKIEGLQLPEVHNYHNPAVQQAV